MRTLRVLVLIAALVAPFASMASESLKILGQSNPAATTLTTLYTVPASTSTVVSTIIITNQVSGAGSFRVTVQPACTTVAAQHYLAFDVPIPGNDSIIMTLGVTLATTDCIRIYASSTTLSFNAFGSEVQ